MNIILWIIFGALVGWVASLVMKTDEKQGAIGNIIVGVIGAFLGGFLMQLVGESGVDGFNLRSFVVALVGAIVLLAVFRAVKRR